MFYNRTPAGGDYVTRRTRRTNERSRTSPEREEGGKRGKVGDETGRKLRRSNTQDNKRRAVRRWEREVRGGSGRGEEERCEEEKIEEEFKLRKYSQVIEEEEEAGVGKVLAG